MSIKPKKSLDQINHYVAAKTIESVKREFGLEKVIKLAGNENTLGYSPYVKQAITDSFEQLSYYPDMNCTQLREKLAELHQVKAEQLIFGNGSFEIISMIAQTFLEEGHEAITIEPSFGWYKNATWQVGGRIIQVPLRDFFVDLEEVKNQITPKTKVIWLCNPNNPVGTIVTGTKLGEFLNQLPKDILLVLDEAYVDYVQEDDFPESVELLRKHNNIIILRTFSKAYGLASLRIGYGIASEEIIQSLNKVRLPINTNALAQVAALASLKDQKFRNEVLVNHQQGLARYYEELERLGLNYIRSNCNFILFDTGLDSEWVAGEYLKRGIILRAGTEFGLPTWLRVSIGTRDENEQVIKILKELVNK